VVFGALQALAQVDNYLRRMSVVREAVDDTAGAAQMIAQQKLQVGGASAILAAAAAVAAAAAAARVQHGLGRSGNIKAGRAGPGLPWSADAYAPSVVHMHGIILGTAATTMIASGTAAGCGKGVPAVSLFLQTNG
jgi:hypothetical protein